MTEQQYKKGDYVRFLKKMGPGLTGSIGEVRFVSEHGLSVRILINSEGRPFQFTVSAQPFANFEPVSAEEFAELERLAQEA